MTYSRILSGVLLGATLTAAAGVSSSGRAHAAGAQGASSTAIVKPDTALLASSSRPETDRARDTARKPLELLSLVPLPKGAKIADLMPGSGYFTRLLSLETGESGHVYAVIPAEMAARHPKMPQTAQAIAADPAFGNVSVVVTPIVDFHVAQPLDLVWTSQNYHDVYGGMGPETAQRMDRAIYQSLKPGGYFMVIDHVAQTGSGTTAPTTLHRIDPALILQQVEGAGFQLVANSPVLHNAQDDHSLPVFDKSIRGNTDQAVFLFRKPAGKDNGN
ncbi:class I SAM-dependent methyltransferase [Asaia krungthepensis]|uniref:Methyltransferase n=1 Tax=Asaia krungthepensis NRIC 0535 TaxID=1307925 RepID=A0ABQ0PZY0_9PROT|nr:methyltransferase [Asaia krungthepensis]GBQ85753.1 putative methyltransferase [Asaia krungthepensis NRIC 0535]